MFQLSWPSLSSKGQVQTVANQGREGMQRQGKSSQETIVQPWVRVLVPPQGIHITISLSSSHIYPFANWRTFWLLPSFGRTKTPNKWKMLTTWWSTLHSREVSLITSRTTEAHQKTTRGQIKGMQALHTPWSLSATPSLNLCYKTPHQIPPGWDTQFWGH